MSSKSHKHTPKSIVNAFYDAERPYMTTPNPSTLSALTATLSPNIKLIQTPDLPYGGTWEGTDGFKRWGEQMSKYFDVVDVQDPVIFTAGADENGVEVSEAASNKVLIQAKVTFRVRRTGRELHYPMVQVIGVDREAGVITSIQPFYWDVKGLVAALQDEGESM